MPPINEVAQLLSIPNRISNIISLLEERSGSKLSVSKTSRNNLENDGVGLSSVKKIYLWMRNLPVAYFQIFTFSVLIKNQRSVRVDSNAGTWISATDCFRRGLYSGVEKYEHGFDPLFKFIENRSNNDLTYLLTRKRKIKNNELDKDNLAALFEDQLPLWKRSSRVPFTALQGFFNFVVQPYKFVDMSDEKIQVMYQSFLYLYFDFYLGAIANYEVGYILWSVQEEESIDEKRVLLNKAIDLFVTEHNVKNCFDGLLHALKLYTTEITGAISWRQMANFIPVDEDESIASGELLNDKQYKCLKDWRKGKNMPSPNLLEKFLRALIIHNGGDAGEGELLLQCRIVMGLGKLNERALNIFPDEVIKKIDAHSALKSVLSEYSNYYQYYLSLEMNK